MNNKDVIRRCLGCIGILSLSSFIVSSVTILNIAGAEKYYEDGIFEDVEDLYLPDLHDGSLSEDTSADVNGTDSCIKLLQQEAFGYDMLSITEEEKYMLAKIVECEAGNQDIHTMELVAFVILNRAYKSDKFPDTIGDVIKQNKNGVYQFSPLISGGTWYTKEPSDNAYIAVENVMACTSDISDGALYFETCKSDDNWHSRNLEFLYKSGAIRFYR